MYLLYGGKMGKVITVINQKGGVAKTTTSFALAAGLCKKGYKVLMVDLDAQSNLTYSAGGTDTEDNIYTVMHEDAGVQESIQRTETCDIIPASILLAGADLEFTQTGREYILRDALERVQDGYDYIVIDTPPALSILTVNALTATDEVIIPVGADVYSLQGLMQLKKTIDQVKKFCNKNLEIKGLLLTKYNPRTIISRDVRDVMKQQAKAIGTKLYKTAIREGVAVRESQMKKQNIFDYAPDSKPAIDYMQLVEEYLED